MLYVLSAAQGNGEAFLRVRHSFCTIPRTFHIAHRCKVGDFHYYGMAGLTRDRKQAAAYYQVGVADSLVFAFAISSV